MVDPQIRAIVRGLEKVTGRLVVKITLDVDANLRETTPVDTGWARANWLPAIGVPVVRDLGQVEATTGNAAAADQERQARLASVLSYRLSRGRVFISNNVPYISELNEGSSRKAPAAFVQRAIRKAITEDIRGFRG